MRGHMSRRVIAGTAVAALAMAGLAACGSDDNSNASAGGTFTAQLAEPQTLLPTNIQDVESAQVASVVYDTLVDYDVEGKSFNEVADSITSDDNQTWTVKLKDWNFHDGTKVTASSFVDAWNFGAYSPNAQVNSSYFSAIDGYEDVTSVDAKKKPKSETMSGLEVVDDTTFTVKLATPNAQWPLQLGYQAFGPLAEACLSDTKACGTKPIGNGPYQFTSWDNNQELIVNKYADYKGTPGNADEIDFKIYDNPQTAFNDAIAGNLDLMRTVPPERKKEAKSTYADQYGEVVLASTLMIAFPLYDQKYDSLKLRQAFAQSFDRQQLIDKFLEGVGEPATGYLPPNFPAFNSGACGDVCTYNPDNAKKLFQESGYEGNIEIFNNADNGLFSMYQALANQATKSLGTQVTIKAVPTFDEFLTLRQDRKLSGPFRAGWVADWPTPDNYLVNIFRTAATATSANDSAYSNKDVDKLLDEAIAEQDLTKSNDLYDQAQVDILKDMPVVPVIWQGDDYIRGTNIDGVASTPFNIYQYPSFTVNGS